MICSDPAVSSLDQRLADTYKVASARGPAREGRPARVAAQHAQQVRHDGVPVRGLRRAPGSAEEGRPGLRDHGAGAGRQLDQRRREQRRVRGSRFLQRPRRAGLRLVRPPRAIRHRHLDAQGLPRAYRRHRRSHRLRFRRQRLVAWPPQPQGRVGRQRAGAEEGEIGADCNAGTAPGRGQPRQLPARSPPPAAIDCQADTRAFGTRRSLCSGISPAACSRPTSRSPR